MLTRMRNLAAALMVLTIFLSGGAQAQSSIDSQEASTAAVPTIPDADEIMLRMSSLLAAQRSFTLHIEKTFDVIQDDGAKVQFSGAADIAVRRPDSIYVDYGDDLSAKEFWYDGQSFTLVDHLHHVYGSLAAAASIDAALDQLANDYGIFLPLAGLFYSDPYERYTAGVSVKRYLGRHDVDGVPSDHFLFRGKKADWQVWIEAGGRPLPTKIVVTQRGIEGAPQHSVLLSDWDFDVALEDGLFTAVIPEGAVKAEFRKSEEQEP